ncbi:MAG: J domain-containing protein [Gammaproteobacteria bacterium]
MLHNHLEILRNALSLGDEDIIALQTRKMAALAEETPSLAELTELLQSQQYAAAVRWLNDYQKQHAAIATYTDPEIDALKLELRAVEQELVTLTTQKEEYVQTLDEFNALYYAHCGELVGQILWLKLAAAKKAPQPQQQEQQAFDDFQQAHQQAKKPPPELSAEDRSELKKMYRRACQLCHPDMLAEKDKARGTKQFQELDAAYKQNNITAVREILSALQSGRDFAGAADSLQEKEALTRQITANRQKIATLKKEVAALLVDEDLQNILAIKDWQAHFAAVRKDLQAELQRLQKEAK